MKIIGVKTVNYTVNGKNHMGFEVAFSYPKESWDGVCVLSAYLPQNVCGLCGYMPIVGDEVKAKIRRIKDSNRLAVSWIVPL